MGTQTQTASDAQAIADFDAAVATQQKRPGFERRRDAAAAVAKANPSLHGSYVRATNPHAVRRKLLDA